MACSYGRDVAIRTRPARTLVHLRSIMGGCRRPVALGGRIERCAGQLFGEVIYVYQRQRANVHRD